MHEFCFLSVKREKWEIFLINFNALQKLSGAYSRLSTLCKCCLTVVAGLASGRETCTVCRTARLPVLHVLKGETCFTQAFMNGECANHLI